MFIYIVISLIVASVASVAIVATLIPPQIFITDTDVKVLLFLLNGIVSIVLGKWDKFKVAH